MQESKKVYPRTLPPLEESELLKQPAKGYCPFASPPDLELARNHGISQRVAKAKDGAPCPCCGFSTQNELFDMQIDVQELTFLGITIPLYFTFVKKCSFLLTIQLFLSTMYNFVINVQGRGCPNLGSICTSSIINSLDSSQSFQVGNQVLHNFLTILVLIFWLELFRIKQSKEIFESGREATPSDYTLQITGFDKNTTYEKVQRFLETYLPDQAVEVHNVYFILNLSSYKKQKEIKLNLMKQRNEYMAKERKENITYTSELQEISEKLSAVECQIAQSQSIMSLNNLNKQSLNTNRCITVEPQEASSIEFCGRVLVTIDRISQQRQICHKFKLGVIQHVAYYLYKRQVLVTLTRAILSKFEFEGDILRVKQAAEPSDVNWLNMGSDTTSWKYVITVIVLCIFASSCVAIYRLKITMKNIPDQDAFLSLFLSLVVSTIVAITNTVLGMIIRIFAARETHKKQTNFYVSVGRRLSILYFVNMVITTFLANVINVNEDNVEKKYRVSSSVQINQGMINDYFFLFLTNTYLSSLFNVFDIMWAVRLWKRYKLKQDGVFSSYSQDEANQLMEGHPVDMALRYANVVKVMFFTAAVVPLVPIGLPMSLFGLLIIYWVDKYLILRRYTCKTYMDVQLANDMINLLRMYVVIFSFGNMLIVFQQPEAKQYRWTNRTDVALSMIGTFIALMYLFGSKLRYFKRMYFYVFGLETPSMQDVSFKDQKFKNTYMQYYPQ